MDLLEQYLKKVYSETSEVFSKSKGMKSFRDFKQKENLDEIPSEISSKVKSMTDIKRKLSYKIIDAIDQGNISAQDVITAAIHFLYPKAILDSFEAYIDNVIAGEDTELPGEDELDSMNDDEV